MKLFFTTVAISLIPFFCYCQTDHCTYNTERLPNNYYRYLQGNYENDSQIDKIISEITSMIGLEKNFVYVNSPGINNCVALNYEGFRYILYDKSFLNKLSQNKSVKQSIYISVLAHEIGHHLQGHTLKNISENDNKLSEIEADKFSGFVMAKFGYSLVEAQEAINSLPQTQSKTHPDKLKRLSAIKEGYEITAQKQNYFIGKIKTELLNTLFVEYFMKGQEDLRNNNIENAIDNFTTSITLNKENNFFPIALRAIAYSKSKLYSQAINDYKKLENINIKDNLAIGDYLYFNRGVTYEKMEDFSKASKDFYKAYELNEKDKVALMKFAVNQTLNGNYKSAILAYEFQLTDDDVYNAELENFTKGDVFYYKALSYYQDNDLVFSEKYFEEAKKLFPKEYPRLALPNFYLGKIFEKKKNYEKALEQYLAFIEINKSEQNYFLYDVNYSKANEVYLSLANIYQEQENYELSTKYINILIEREPKLPNSYITRGLNNYYKNNLENAKSDFLKSCDLGLSQGCELMEKLKNNTIKKDKQKNSKYITGGYKTNKILEYTYNTSTKEYDLTNELNIQSKLYFDVDNYSFKRGENDWLHSSWTYQNYDEISQRHFYLDNYEQTITFDKDYKTITWYTKEINNVFQKIIIYTELIEDKTIKPDK
jgi:tetratricopeptide (TPR) repeat protein